jgi:hypothetical protein
VALAEAAFDGVLRRLGKPLDSFAETPPPKLRLRSGGDPVAETADSSLGGRSWPPAQALVEAVLDLLGRGRVFSLGLESSTACPPSLIGCSERVVVVTLRRRDRLRRGLVTGRRGGCRAGNLEKRPDQVERKREDDGRVLVIADLGEGLQVAQLQRDGIRLITSAASRRRSEA